VSQERINYLQNQVISKKKVEQMELLFSKHDQKFHKTLSNLILSANNPFQSNFNYIVDQHYVKQE
jgi:hypothetical protein